MLEAWFLELPMIRDSEPLRGGAPWSCLQKELRYPTTPPVISGKRIVEALSTSGILASHPLGSATVVPSIVIPPEGRLME